MWRELLGDLGGEWSTLTGGGAVDEDLFEDLLESIQEAGAILRGEREATRRTKLSDEVKEAGPPEDLEQGETIE